MFNAEAVNSPTFPVADGSAEKTKSRTKRSRRRSDPLFGGAALLATPWVFLYPGLWTLLLCIFMVALYIGRRSIPRVLTFFAFALFPYQLIWATFIVLRGLADQAPWVDRVRLWPRQVEVTLFGGELLNSRLQGWFFDPAHLRPYDYFFTSLHISFFVVPLLAAMPLCWVDPARGRRFLVTLAVLLALGLPFFYLVPANPPWMDPVTGDPNPVAVHRINAIVATDWGVDTFHPDGTLDGELNSLAVVPSMHMGVSFLLALSAPRKRRRWRQITAAYAGLMAFSLVYLGEHFVTDEVVGIGLAVVAWRIAPWVIAKMSLTLAPLANPVQQRFARLVEAGRRKSASRREPLGPVRSDGSVS